MTTYAHVTVTVVTDGVTTTYDIPKVEDFVMVHDTPVRERYGHLEPSVPRTISFKMNPRPTGDDSSIYTVTTDAPRLAESKP